MYETKKLSEEEALEIENRLLRDMADHYGRQIEAEQKRLAAERVRIRITVNRRAPHLRKGAVYSAKPGKGKNNAPIYWINHGGNTLSVRADECVLLDTQDNVVADGYGNPLKTG